MDRWLQNPKVVLVIAVLFAILLWGVVHLDEQQNKPLPTVTETNTSTEIDDVSIEQVGLDDAKYSLISVEPQDVRLRIRGSSTALKKISPLHSKVQLDLTNAENGKQVIRLKHTGFPNGLEVEIIPDSVLVTIEEKLKKEMPVVPVVKGEPKQGFVAGTPVVQPNRAFVTVPESQIDNVMTIRGEIDIAGASEAVRKQIKLDAYDKNGEKVDVQIEPSIVDVEVPITEPSKSMTLQVQLLGNPAEGYSLAGMEQNPLQVTVYGKQSILDALEFYDGLQVDLSGMNASRTLMLDIPLRTDVSRIEPNKVEVKLNIVPSERRTFQQLGMEITGLTDQYEASFVEPAAGTIDVTVEGAPNILDGLEPEDIDLIVDVTNLSPGQHRVPVGYSLPSFVRIVPSDNLTVTINVKEIVEQNTQ